MPGSDDSDEEAGLFQTGDLGMSAWEDAPFSAASIQAASDAAAAAELLLPASDTAGLAASTGTGAAPQSPSSRRQPAGSGGASLGSSPLRRSSSDAARKTAAGGGPYVRPAGRRSGSGSLDSPTTARTPRSPASRKSPPYVLDVDRRIFERLLISPDMAVDHLPDNYLYEIQEL